MKPFRLSSSSFPFSRHPLKCLTIAGFDPCSFAGVTADLRTFLSLGVFGLSAITTLTAQNPNRFDRCLPVNAELFSRQIDLILEQFGPLPIKIGLVSSLDIVQVLAERLSSFGSAFIALDPIFSVSAGDYSSSDSIRFAMMDSLFPLSSVITPNILEAEIILGRSIRDFDSMSAAASEIHSRFGCSTLLKGGHLPAEFDSCDFLCHEQRVYRFDSPRVAEGSAHGSGCFLSASITAFSALSYDLPQSVKMAKKHIFEAFSASIDVDGFPLLHSSPR